MPQCKDFTKTLLPHFKNGFRASKLNLLILLSLRRVNNLCWHAEIFGFYLLSSLNLGEEWKKERKPVGACWLCKNVLQFWSLCQLDMRNCWNISDGFRKPAAPPDQIWSRTGGMEDFTIKLSSGVEFGAPSLQQVSFSQRKHNYTKQRLTCKYGVYS